MKASTKQEASSKLMQKALKLAEDVPGNILDLSVALWELQENNIYDVKDFCEKAGLGHRKTYYLIDIGRAFYNLPVAPDRLKAIGWTKLKSLAPHITADNWKEKLELAEKYKASDLDKVLRGESLVEEEKVWILRFSAKDRERLDKLLLDNGATKSGSGLVDKETALMNIVTELGY